jgi:acetylornithine deacetylase/succinyl-diaminopimelate desuccinylase-like protein
MESPSSRSLRQDYLHQDPLVGWLQRLVRTPSEQTELQERDPHVLAFIKECAAPLLDEIGASYRFDAMGNLIAQAGPADSGRSLMFVTYAMTHPAARMTDPFAAEVIETARGPALRGRGVAEQKTALAAALGAFAAALARGNLGGRLTLALTTAGETGRHDAVASVLRALDAAPRFAIICIGTDGRVAVGNKGRLDVDVIVKGRAAHSSVPRQGVNAITGAQRVLERLERLDLGVGDHPKFGPATLTATAIDSAPKATHTVPDTVRITFDRRLLPGEDPAAAFAALERAVAIGPPWSVECRQGPLMYPNEIALDGPLYGHLRAAFAAAGRGEPQPFYCNFALDAGYFARQRIEAVMLGPGEVDQFHSGEEQVLIAELVGLANVYDRMIAQCLAPNA